MILREAKWKECPCCGRRGDLLQDEKYGCDECKKEIDMSKPGSDYLRVTVHSNDERARSMEFCSWRCTVKGLKKIKTDYFIAMPFLNYDTRKKGLMATDFFKLIKP